MAGIEKDCATQVGKRPFRFPAAEIADTAPIICFCIVRIAVNRLIEACEILLISIAHVEPRSYSSREDDTIT